MRRRARRWARALVGSRLTRRYLWARWVMSRANALVARRRLYRRTSVEWDMPGHARLVYSDILGPGRGEVLVRTIASAVSPGTERAGFRSETTSAKFPALPGYSLTGEVVARGRGVREGAVGAIVATQAPHASLVVRPHDLVFQLGPGTDPVHAAILYPGMIALHGIWRGGLQPGDRVVVYGRGLIGQLTLLLARALRAAEVVSVARSRGRLSSAMLSAADSVLATGEGERPEAGEADLVVEASGNPRAISEAVEAVRPGGRIVLLGSPRQAIPFDFASAADRRVTLIGAHISTLSRDIRSSGNDYGSAAATFLRFIDDGLIDVGSLIGEEVDPWEAGRFYRRLSQRGLTIAGAVFRWDLLPDSDRGGPIGFFTPPIDDLSRGMTFRREPMGTS